MFKGYTPEPDSSAFIDTSHASFALADIQAANFRGSLVGNADTATKLAATKTINGTAFDGSANITFGTDSVAEGSTNLYYTDTRVGSYLTTNNYATQTYAQQQANDAAVAMAIALG